MLHAVLTTNIHVCTSNLGSVSCQKLVIEVTFGEMKIGNHAIFTVSECKTINLYTPTLSGPDSEHTPVSRIVLNKMSHDMLRLL